MRRPVSVRAGGFTLLEQYDPAARALLLSREDVRRDPHLRQGDAFRARRRSTHQSRPCGGGIPCATRSAASCRCRSVRTRALATNVVFEGDHKFMRFVAPMQAIFPRAVPYVQTLEFAGSRAADGS